jgi:hypothetical protein
MTKLTEELEYLKRIRKYHIDAIDRLRELLYVVDRQIESLEIAIGEEDRVSEWKKRRLL